MHANTTVYTYPCKHPITECELKLNTCIDLVNVVVLADSEFVRISLVNVVVLADSEFVRINLVNVVVLADSEFVQSVCLQY
jgi:hypothetical protein